MFTGTEKRIRKKEIEMAAFNRISESEIGRIQELEAQGRTCKQISELTGRSANAVRKHLNVSPPSNLPMGESEIAASFRQAKNPTEQVEIEPFPLK